MSIVRAAIVIAAAALSSVSAQAASFLFSETVGSYSVTGSFNGTLNGNLITDLSNIIVKINGNSISSTPLYSARYTGSGWDSNGAYASLDGTQNNFLFIDSAYPQNTSFTAYFYSVNGQGNNFGDSVYSQPMSVNASNPGGNDNFQATQVSSAVPEPATWAMMIGGFGLIGYAMRRQRKAVVRFG